MDKKFHLWMSAACLLLIAAGVASVTIFGLSGRSLLWFGFLLLCPLLHFFMMRNMDHENPTTLHHESTKEIDHE